MATPQQNREYAEEATASPLYLFRHLKRWSQAELAERAQIGRDTVSHLESGFQRPRIDTANRLSLALEVPVDVLFPPDNGQERE